MKSKVKKSAASTKDAGYVFCPVGRRIELFVELVCRYYDFTNNCWTKKIALVFCHSNCVKYFVDLFNWYKSFHIHPLTLKGLQKTDGQEEYESLMEEENFCVALKSSLVSKLSNFKVEVLIQFDPPSSVDEVSSLSAISEWYTLFLRPEESKFVELLKTSISHLKERRVPWNTVPELAKLRFHRRYSTNHLSNISSKGVFKAYLDQLGSHSLVNYFNLSEIKYKEVSDSLCLPILPYYAPPLPAVDAPKERPSDGVKVVRSYKRVVRTHDGDAAAEKLKAKQIKVMKKQKRIAPQMRIKNLSRGLPRNKAVFTGKEKETLHKKLGVPAHFTYTVVKSDE